MIPGYLSQEFLITSSPAVQQTVVNSALETVLRIRVPNLMDAAENSFVLISISPLPREANVDTKH